MLFDAEHFDAYTGGDYELQRSVIELFIKNAPDYMNILSKPNNENWRADAHKLKGAARSIGAWHLACLAERAEKLPSQKSNEGLQAKILQGLTERLEKTIQHLEVIYFSDAISK